MIFENSGFKEEFRFLLLDSSIMGRFEKRNSAKKEDLAANQWKEEIVKKMERFLKCSLFK